MAKDQKMSSFGFDYNPSNKLVPVSKTKETRMCLQSEFDAQAGAQNVEEYSQNLVKIRRNYNLQLVRHMSIGQFTIVLGHTMM